jgi:hypothetical protein
MRHKGCEDYKWGDLEAIVTAWEERAVAGAYACLTDRQTFVQWVALEEAISADESACFDRQKIDIFMRYITGPCGWFGCLGGVELTDQEKGAILFSFLRIEAFLCRHGFEDLAFMWFDNLLTFSGGARPLSKNTVVCVSLLTCLRNLLLNENRSSLCQKKAALHGLAHAVNLRIRGAKAILRRFLASQPDSQELVAYATSCLQGHEI